LPSRSLTIKINPKRRMNIARRTSIGSVSYDTFAFAARALLSVFASFADIAKPATVTVASRTLTATVAGGTNSFAHSVMISCEI
jgi:hypothetical protein